MTPLSLSHCTLTGADDRVALSDLAELSNRFPVVEWGFLYSPERQGTPGRYPAVNKLREALNELPSGVRCALHVCGQGVSDLLAGEATVTLLAIYVAARGGRLQLNFNQRRKPINLDRLSYFIERYPNLQVITQYNEANQPVAEALRAHRNHAVLFDKSGGQGLLPDHWPSPLPDTSCGYAGGLGPDNIDVQLESIARVADDRPFWIDMEGQLRVKDSADVDWFDLGRCRKVLEIVTNRTLIEARAS